MCYAKPGPRCSTVARERLTRAHIRYELVAADPDACADSIETASAAVIAAQHDFYLTPAGIGDLRDSGRGEQADLYQERREALISELSEDPVACMRDQSSLSTERVLGSVDVMARFDRFENDLAELIPAIDADRARYDCVDWTARTALPVVLEHARCVQEAEALRQLPPVTDEQSYVRTREAVRALALRLDRAQDDENLRLTHQVSTQLRDQHVSESEITDTVDGLRMGINAAVTAGYAHPPAAACSAAGDYSPAASAASVVRSCARLTVMESLSDRTLQPSHWAQTSRDVRAVGEHHLRVRHATRDAALMDGIDELIARLRKHSDDPVLVQATAG